MLTKGALFKGPTKRKYNNNLPRSKKTARKHAVATKKHNQQHQVSTQRKNNSYHC